MIVVSIKVNMKYDLNTKGKEDWEDKKIDLRLCAYLIGFTVELAFRVGRVQTVACPDPSVTTSVGTLLGHPPGRGSHPAVTRHDPSYGGRVGLVVGGAPWRGHRALTVAGHHPTSHVVHPVGNQWRNALCRLFYWTFFRTLNQLELAKPWVFPKISWVYLKNPRVFRKFAWV